MQSTFSGSSIVTGSEVLVIRCQLFGNWSGATRGKPIPQGRRPIGLVRGSHWSPLLSPTQQRRSCATGKGPPVVGLRRCARVFERHHLSKRCIVMVAKTFAFASGRSIGHTATTRVKSGAVDRSPTCLPCPKSLRCAPPFVPPLGSFAGFLGVFTSFSSPLRGTCKACCSKELQQASLLRSSGGKSLSGEKSRRYAGSGWPRRAKPRPPLDQRPQ
jgi:hypothetical protein